MIMPLVVIKFYLSISCVGYKTLHNTNCQIQAMEQQDSISPLGLISLQTAVSLLMKYMFKLDMCAVR